jgi:hypothetical protein
VLSEAWHEGKAQLAELSDDRCRFWGWYLDIRTYSVDLRAVSAYSEMAHVWTDREITKAVP